MEAYTYGNYYHKMAHHRKYELFIHFFHFLGKHSLYFIAVTIHNAYNLEGFKQ